MAAPSAKTSPVAPPVAALAALAVPGVGHLILGRLQKGVIFLLALPAMFGLGLALSGRIVPFEPTQPLVFLMAFAQRGVGVLAVAAQALELGRGVVTAVTFEYGNAFLIVSGLLNMLVALDAYDIAMGRK